MQKRNLSTVLIIILALLIMLLVYFVFEKRMESLEKKIHLEKTDTL